MDNRRRPIAIAKDMSELRYRHLLLARTTVAWYSGRSRREEVILSSVCLYVSDAHSLTAGGRSTRLGEEFYAVSQTISCVAPRLYKVFICGNKVQAKDVAVNVFSSL